MNPYGYPNMWGPPVWGMMPQNDEQAVKLAKQIIKLHKADKKKKETEEKEKKDKAKPRMFSLLEATGLVFFFSIPVVLCQLWLISYAQHMMNVLMNAPN